MSTPDQHYERLSVQKDSSMVEDHLARRNRLAQLLGRLLARYWLRLRDKKAGATPQEDSQKP